MSYDSFIMNLKQRPTTCGEYFDITASYKFDLEYAGFDAIKIQTLEHGGWGDWKAFKPRRTFYRAREMSVSLKEAPEPRDYLGLLNSSVEPQEEATRFCHFSNSANSPRLTKNWMTRTCHRKNLKTDHCKYAGTAESSKIPRLF